MYCCSVCDEVPRPLQVGYHRNQVNMHHIHKIHAHPLWRTFSVAEIESPQNTFFLFKVLTLSLVKQLFWNFYCIPITITCTFSLLTYVTKNLVYGVIWFCYASFMWFIRIVTKMCTISFFFLCIGPATSHPIEQLSIPTGFPDYAFPGFFFKLVIHPKKLPYAFSWVGITFPQWMYR